MPTLKYWDMGTASWKSVTVEGPQGPQGPQGLPGQVLAPYWGRVSRETDGSIAPDVTYQVVFETFGTAGYLGMRNPVMNSGGWVTPEPGLYIIDAEVQYGVVSSTGRISLNITSSGSIIPSPSRNLRGSTTGNTNIQKTSAIIPLDAGKTIGLQVSAYGNTITPTNYAMSVAGPIIGGTLVQPQPSIDDVAKGVVAYFQATGAVSTSTTDGYTSPMCATTVTLDANRRYRVDWSALFDDSAAGTGFGARCLFEVIRGTFNFEYSGLHVPRGPIVSQYDTAYNTIGGSATFTVPISGTFDVQMRGFKVSSGGTLRMTAPGYVITDEGPANRNVLAPVT